MFFIEPVVGNLYVQLIQVWLFPQLRQSVESDVAINYVFHAGLGLAYIVDAACDKKRLLFPSCRLDSQLIADLRPRYSESVSLDQYLTSGRRPCALLRAELAEAYVAVVLHHKEHQVAPFHGSSFDPARNDSSRLRVADFV